MPQEITQALVAALRGLLKKVGYEDVSNDDLQYHIEWGAESYKSILNACEALAQYDAFINQQTPLRSGVDETQFMKAIATLGEPDDEFNKWHMDEGELRSFAWKVVGAV